MDEDDLVACRRLSALLGMQQDHVEAVSADPAELAAARRSLEAAARERERMLAEWASVPGRLASVATSFAVGPEVLLADVAAMRWTAARAHMAPVLQRLARAEASAAAPRPGSMGEVADLGEPRA